MIKLKHLLPVLLSGISITLTAYFPGDKLWHGAIKFPLTTKDIPQIQVFYAGTKIPSEIQAANKQVLFDIPESKIRKNFYMAITDKIDIVNEQNTIKYLSAAKDHPYKLYHLEFCPATECAEKQVDAAQLGSWQVAQIDPGDDNRIPDNSIIVLYHAHLVKDVEGGNGLELPKVILNEQLLCKLNEAELRDASAQFTLAALDCNSIHARQHAQIKADFAKKTVISMICS